MINISSKDIYELNDVKNGLSQTIMTKLTNAGIYFHIATRVKSQESLARKLDSGKYGMGPDDKKIQDIIGIRINLFYTEDMAICESILEDTFVVDNWSKTVWAENRFEAQKCNGVFRLPSKYLVNLSDGLWANAFDKTFEVQLRTVLFEGWHEIEHEMRYKYKIGEASDDLWAGQEKDARMMNSIIANLELCDWSIVQIFDNISHDHLERGNWENAIRSKLRLRITSDPLKAEVKEYFDKKPEVVEQILAVSKKQLVDILLNKKYQKVLSMNRIIYLINKEIIGDPYISELLDHEQFGRVLNKEVKPEMKPLVSDVVFAQKIRIADGGFDKACEIIYDWAYQHMSTIFGQMPKKFTPATYTAIGYGLSVSLEENRFYMDLHHISNEEAGVVWHVTAELTKTEDGTFVDCKNICENIYSRERRYNRPRFMRDIFNQVGYVDAGVTLNEKTGVKEISQRQLEGLVNDKTRTLPVILIEKPEVMPFWAKDFDGSVINAEVLAKSLAGICHVVCANPACKKKLDKIYNVDGAILYFGKSMEYSQIFTMEAIGAACFEEINHSVDENEEYEKAFRYQLRELACQEFT